MPAPAEKEAKSSSTLKDIRNAAIVTVLLLAFTRGHQIRMDEQREKSVPDVIPSVSTCTSPTPEVLTKARESIVIYQRTPQNRK